MNTELRITEAVVALGIPDAEAVDGLILTLAAVAVRAEIPSESLVARIRAARATAAEVRQELIQEGVEC